MRNHKRRATPTRSDELLRERASERDESNGCARMIEREEQHMRNIINNYANEQASERVREQQEREREREKTRDNRRMPKMSYLCWHSNIQ